jgi:exopolyphosphatase/guanosine-5'-triphosphate,3'-diphosphate pyrophosphatase
MINRGIIACDLGSNTLRIVEIDTLTKERLCEYEKTVRTAKDLHKTGIISEESKKRIFDALSEANEIFDFKTKEVYCVTTEAMRRAKNASEILCEIKKRVGLDFVIIDGDEEARLTLLGVENALLKLGIDNSKYCMMDLGGGSTELSFKSKKETKSKSFPFGIVHIAEKYGSLEAIEKGIEKELHVIDSYLAEQQGMPYRYFIATSGTPTTVCAFLQGIDYASYDYKKINGKSLHVDDFTRALEKLLSMNESQREFWVGTNRSDLVCAGILIVKAIMQKLGFTECIVIDDGLREGLALSKCI